jgi:hypothetical protein
MLTITRPQQYKSDAHAGIRENRNSSLDADALLKLCMALIRSILSSEPYHGHPDLHVYHAGLNVQRRDTKTVPP